MAEAQDTAIGMGEDRKLDQADKAMTLAEGKAEEHHAEPALFGLLPPGMIVALAMTVLFGLLLWKRVPATVVSGLDKQIDAIRQQLDEAKALRAEAEKLRAEYAAKIAGAEKDAAAMLEHARTEAESIVATAEADTSALIGRREKMASDKIAAAERGAIEELRRQAAGLASAAAGKLIAEKHGHDADRKLADEIIAGI